MILRDRSERELKPGQAVRLEGRVELVPGTGAEVLVRVDDALAVWLPAKTVKGD